MRDVIKFQTRRPVFAEAKQDSSRIRGRTYLSNLPHARRTSWRPNRLGIFQVPGQKRAKGRLVKREAFPRKVSLFVYPGSAPLFQKGCYNLCRLEPLGKLKGGKRARGSDAVKLSLLPFLRVFASQRLPVFLTMRVRSEFHVNRSPGPG